MLLDTRPMPLGHETANAQAFAMCPAALWVQQHQPAALHPLYAYALEQAQRATGLDRFRRLQMWSMN